MVIRDSRTAATANVGPGSRHEPQPVLIGFRGTTVVRVVKELLNNIVAYRGREEPGDLESFLDWAMSGIDPALGVALNLALLADGQAAAEAGTRLLREAESKVRLTSAGRTVPETTKRAKIDAKFRLQMFLGGFGYLEAYMRSRKLDGHEEAPKSKREPDYHRRGQPRQRWFRLALSFCQNHARSPFRQH